MNFMQEPLSTGTTIMAAIFDGGVVLGADSRTSMGNYVVNRFADKITHITDKIYCCRSGSSADTQAITDLVRTSIEYQAVCSGQEPTVRFVANEVRNVCYTNRNTMLASMIIAGWDKLKGAQVFAVPIGGFLIQEDICAAGSGAITVDALVRESYREGMEKDECVELVVKAIKKAIKFDGATGGVIRIGVITEDGMEKSIYDTKSEEKTCKLFGFE